MATLEHMSLADSLLVSLLGICVVFFVLILISFFIRIISKILSVGAKKAPAAAPVAASAAPAAPAADPNKVPAPGSLGEIKLFDVDDQTAAMVMAIVADELKAPLNELRFISIKERKKD
ncbi:MAG: hypothetical protein E7430_08465 [Ruminococcaceae bacterium]|nr:hypothetical protein [Oscillospiraceae bacterium]